MTVEQRVVSKQKIGAKSSPAPEAAPAAAEPAKGGGGKKKLLIIVAGVLVVGGAAAWFLLGRGGGDAEPAAEPAPEPGEVVQVEAISVNLADGHYLRLGMGLQLTADAGGEHGPVDPSRALDLAISLYSGRTMAEVSDPATREALKAQLKDQLAEAYHEEVMDVYLTNFVTQ